MCAAAAMPRWPPSTASAIISAYQNTPSPSRLIMPKNRPTTRRAPQWLAITQTRRSSAKRGPGRNSDVGGDGGVFMQVLLGHLAQQGFEITNYRVRRKPGHAGVGGTAHMPDQRRVAGKFRR